MLYTLACGNYAGISLGILIANAILTIIWEQSRINENSAGIK